MPAAETVIPPVLTVDATGVYLAGSVGFGRAELFIRKYDEGGNELWSRRLRISDDGYHLAAGMSADSSGLYVAVWDGRTQGLVRKYSPAGDELWSRSISVRSLRGLTVDGGVYVSGLNHGGGFVSKFTTGGDVLWTHQLDSSETETIVPAAVASDASGVYVGGSVFHRLSPDNFAFIPET